MRGSPIRLGELHGQDLVAFALDEVDLTLPGLSPAESEVVLFALMGLPNRAIARARGSSDRTVANQLRAAYDKLGVRSRSELVHRMGNAASRA